MASNEQVVKQSIIDNTAPDLYNTDYESFEKLKLAATNFISNAENMLNQTRHIKNKSLKNSLTDFYKLMRESTNFTQEALQLQHNFEIQLNKFLNRVIYLTWVDDTGHLSYFDEARIGEIYTKATANRGRGNVSSSTMEKFINTNDLVNDLKNRLKHAEQLRIGVYQEAIKRWASNDNEQVKKYNPSDKTFYWRLIDNHHITGHTPPIASKGIIAEGYAGAVINEDYNVVSSSMEFSLRNLYQNHIRKDSIGAAIKGDITWNENGNIQFAIKEGSFSTARFGQYLNLAYNTLQIERITVEQYKKYLPKLIRLSNLATQIINNINEETKKQLDREIQKVAPLV